MSVYQLCLTDLHEDLYKQKHMVVICETGKLVKTLFITIASNNLSHPLPFITTTITSHSLCHSSHQLTITSHSL